MKYLSIRSVLFALVSIAMFQSSFSAAADYRVSKGDLLSVSVHQWPEYSGQTRVDDFGLISLPALGRVPVAGLTLELIEQKIVEKLSTFSDNPGFRVVVDVADQ